MTLTAALGTSLNNALFVLDEPTVGLHPADVAAGRNPARASRRDNMVLVVEHDPSVIAGADRVIELGPGAGTAAARSCSTARRELDRRHFGHRPRAVRARARRAREAQLRARIYG